MSWSTGVKPTTRRLLRDNPRPLRGGHRKCFCGLEGPVVLRAETQVLVTSNGARGRFSRRCKNACGDLVGDFDESLAACSVISSVARMSYAVSQSRAGRISIPLWMLLIYEAIE